MIVIVAFLVILLFILLLFFVAFMTYFKPWLQAYMSGAQVSLFDLLGMSFRKIKISTIVDCRIMSVQAGFPVSVNELQSGYLSGADVEMVTLAYIDAKKSGKDFSFEELVDAERSESLAKMLNK